jgi:hypothetical protein
MEIRLAINEKVNHLTPRMNPSIGASRALNVPYLRS